MFLITLLGIVFDLNGFVDVAASCCCCCWKKMLGDAIEVKEMLIN